MYGFEENGHVWWTATIEERRQVLGDARGELRIDAFTADYEDVSMRHAVSVAIGTAIQGKLESHVW